MTSLDPQKDEIILIFASNTAILEAEDLLDERDMPFILVPVPKEVNPNCGLAISFLEPDKDLIMSALEEGGLCPSSAWRRKGDDFSPWPA
jgi:hypothetical protein